MWQQDERLFGTRPPEADDHRVSLDADPHRHLPPPPAGAAPVAPAAVAAPVARSARRWPVLAAAVVLSVVAGGVAGGIAGTMTGDDGGRAATATTLAVASTAAPATTVASARATDSLPALVTAISRSVVSIDVTATTTGFRGQQVTQQGAGTGFVLSANGSIATNAHVVSGAKTISVTLPDGSQIPATLVGIDSDADLAVVHVDRSDLVPVELATAGDIQVGESVLAIGNALALQGGLTASFGIVSALERSISTSTGQSYQHLVQTDAAINSGDSGGPLVNMDGKVIGVNTAGATSAENVGFAIPVSVAAPILARLAGIAG